MLNTTWHMFQNLKLVIKLLKAKTTFIAPCRRMLYKVMTLQFMSCGEPFWTFIAHVVFYTSMHTQVMVQLISFQKLLWTLITFIPTAIIMFINEMSLVQHVGLKLT